MFALCGTEKLRKTLGLPLTAAATGAAPPPTTTVLGDWYAKLISARPRVVLCISAETFLPVLVAGDKLRERLVDYLRAGVTDSLRTLRISEPHIQAELAAMASYAVAKTANRQMLGMMVDFAHQARFHLDHGDSLEVVMRRLGDTPCSPLTDGTPLAATRRRFAELLQN